MPRRVVPYLLAIVATAALGAGAALVAGVTGVVPANAATPSATWTVVDTRCVQGVVHLDVKIAGAVVGQSYAIYGTSGLRATNEEAVARATVFTTTFTPSEAYGANDSSHFSVMGDVEAPAIHQGSQIRTIDASCPTPPESATRIVIPTGASATELPRAVPPTVQQPTPPSHTARNVTIVVLVVAVVLAAGILGRRRRWFRGNRSD